MGNSVDDFIVIGMEIEEHLSNLSTRFARLMNANFKVKLAKCAFIYEEMDV